MVTDAFKNELMFMRKLQVYKEVLVRYMDKSSLTDRKTMERRCHESIHPSPTSCARNQESERVDDGRRGQHVCGHPQWRVSSLCSVDCMTGNQRAPAELKVLGFYHINRAHCHNTAQYRDQGAT